MARDFTTYLPGHGNRTIDKAHGMIIDLRKEKAGILQNWNTAIFGKEDRDHQLAIIDEQIKQWEEVIKLWSGKMEPSRNKLLWSVLVPLCISLIVPLLLFYFVGKTD